MAYIRKTKDEYQILGDYGYGWECLFAEETLKEAKQMLKDYNENEPQYAHKIKKVRVPIGG